MKYLNKSFWKMATAFIVLIILALVVFGFARSYIAKGCENITCAFS